MYPYPNLPYPVGSEYLINEIVVRTVKHFKIWLESYKADLGSMLTISNGSMTSAHVKPNTFE